MDGALPFSAPVGQVLFRPEEPCRGFVRLREGVIRVSLTGANGREIVLYRVRPGQVCLQTFACLANGAPYGAEGVAETALEGELIPAGEFQRRLADDAGFRAEVLGAVAARFREFEQLVESVALDSFEARLARVLLRLADPSGIVRLTHEALAAETGSGRAVVSRQLERFARDGWVSLGRGSLTLLRPDRLAIAAGD